MKHIQSVMAMAVVSVLTGCGNLVQGIEDGVRQAAIDTVMAEVR